MMMIYEQQVVRRTWSGGVRIEPRRSSPSILLSSSKHIWTGKVTGTACLGQNDSAYGDNQIHFYWQRRVQQRPQDCFFTGNRAWSVPGLWRRGRKVYIYYQRRNIWGQQLTHGFACRHKLTHLLWALLGTINQFTLDALVGDGRDIHQNLRRAVSFINYFLNDWIC